MNGVARRKGSFWRTVRAVAWSFVGLRKGSEYQEDMAQLHPVHIIVVGIAGCLVFVAALMFLVNWVVGK
jgi:hypothetical protein